MRKNYPSDITREQFEQIRMDLSTAKKTTHPRTYDLYDILSLMKKVLVDGGYTGETFADTIKFLSGAEVEVAKRSELHTFAVIPKRWGVESTFGWLDKCRRLWKNCERKLQNTFQMVTIAFIRLFLKRC